MIELTIGDRDYATQDTGGTNQPGILNLLSGKISDVISPTGDTLSLRGHVRNPVDNTTAIPDTEETINLFFTNPNGGNRSQLFGGAIQTVNGSIYSFNSVNFNIEARDFLKQLNGILVSGVFTELTVPEMVRSLMRQFAPTFPLRIFSDETEKVLPKVFNFRTIGDVLQELADISFGGWQMLPAREVLFVTQGRIDAPIVTDFGIGQTPFREFDPPNLLVPEESGATEVRGFRWRKTTENLTNSLIVKDFNFRDPDLTYFPMEFDPDDETTDNVGESLDPTGRGRVVIQSVPHNLSEVLFQYRLNATQEWQNVPVRWDGNPSTPIDDLRSGVVWAAPGNKGTTCAFRWRLGNLSSATAPSFRFRYRASLVSIFAEITQESASIAEFQDREGPLSNGTYEKLISLEDLEFIGENPLDNLTEYGHSILSLFAWPIVSGSFKTDSMQFENHWRSGQHFYLLSPQYNLFDLRKSKENEVSGDEIYYDSSGDYKFDNALLVWITNVAIDIKSSELIEYKIEFSNVRPGFHGI